MVGGAEDEEADGFRKSNYFTFQYFSGISAKNNCTSVLQKDDGRLERARVDCTVELQQVFEEWVTERGPKYSSRPYRVKIVLGRLGLHTHTDIR